MTHLMTDEENKTFLYRPEREEHFSAPSLENFQAHLAIVVPVKDNQEGIEKLLESFLDNCILNPWTRVTRLIQAIDFNIIIWLSTHHPFRHAAF
ncbi:MAG: hypothetical protein ACK5NY_05590 [Burkholderiaceae bacterium]